MVGEMLKTNSTLTELDLGRKEIFTMRKVFCFVLF